MVTLKHHRARDRELSTCYEIKGPLGRSQHSDGTPFEFLIELEDEERLVPPTPLHSALLPLNIGFHHNAAAAVPASFLLDRPTELTATRERAHASKRRKELASEFRSRRSIE